MGEYKRHRLRFVGGPKHGEYITVDGVQMHLRVPVDTYDSMAWKQPPDVYAPTFRTVTYERRPVQFGPNTRVDLLVESSLSEQAMMRRIADLVEGVNG